MGKVVFRIDGTEYTYQYGILFEGPPEIERVIRYWGDAVDDLTSKPGMVFSYEMMGETVSNELREKGYVVDVIEVEEEGPLPEGAVS